MDLGDRIVVVVQKQRAAGSEGASATALTNKVRRGDIRHAVIVRVKKELQRADGTVVRFGDNACVLVNKAGDPIGTRMNGQSSGISILGLSQITDALLQESWARNSEASSGPRFYHWHRCMYNIYSDFSDYDLGIGKACLRKHFIVSIRPCPFEKTSDSRCARAPISSLPNSKACKNLQPTNREKTMKGYRGVAPNHKSKFTQFT